MLDQKNTLLNEQKINRLETLPLEVRTNILLNFESLENLCKAYDNSEEPICEDLDFWSEKSLLDFNFPKLYFEDKNKRLSPLELYIYIKNIFDNEDAKKMFENQYEYSNYSDYYEFLLNGIYL